MMSFLMPFKESKIEVNSPVIVDDVDVIKKQAIDFRVRRISNELEYAKNYINKIMRKAAKKGFLGAEMTRHTTYLPETRALIHNYLTSKGYYVDNNTRRSGCDCYSHFSWSWISDTHKIQQLAATKLENQLK